MQGELDGMVRWFGQAEGDAAALEVKKRNGDVQRVYTDDSGSERLRKASGAA
jgi:hypothetical protein